MVNTLFHIWLSIVIVLNSMIFSVIQMDYAINKEYIAENFCINKDKPEMHCDGKCFLAEKLKSAQNQQEQQPGAIDFSRDFGIYIIHENGIAFNKSQSICFKATAFYSENKIVFKAEGIFHPPKDIA
ncbi:hypothetical protein KZP23_13700 [Echinicola marina]|uniref:hypothetical protein n=1 Tax=Echinicola marina TaxID=2859768 RepID=UPI001CF718CA|nr:hypothetical protein [Echinicola marina]UCS91789.1 hypothetical protein KZP23_13700 [Echinicola marina]